MMQRSLSMHGVFALSKNDSITNNAAFWGSVICTHTEINFAFITYSLPHFEQFSTKTSNYLPYPA